jgi:Family of unknown function (DUF6114)/zinc-ribbon domain
LATPSYPTVLPGQYGPPPSEARPVAAFVVSIVGGMFILLSGIFELWIISAIGTVVYPPGPFGFFAVFAIVGIAGGVLVIGFSVLLFSHPQHHVSLGVLILVFSLLSVLSDWGFVIGLVLGIVGGILAIVWTPNRWPTPWYPAPGGWSPYGPYPVAPPAQRVCLKCGRMVAPDSKYCPQCGNPLPG